MRTLLVVGALLLGASTAAAQTAAPTPRPFARGTMVGGGILGLSTGGGRTDFAVGATFGYYVLDGISPGISTLLTVSNVAPTTLEVAPHVRIVPWRAYPVSPILLVRGGYLLIGDGYDDVWFIGGGGGIAYFLSPRVAITFEVIYTRYLTDSPLVRQDDVAITGGVGVYF